ncbi:Right origin-binding protein (plasmid) [Streptomyces sp. ADI95-16]|uniref:helix-turn-helix domain-containing protein n=1 Tax=unclassified Streptomyces TaxID=2593676 RepID=UPI000F3A94A5|nr:MULTISPECIES: AraC family transcriptional regulator [unclassified Streptomyces]AYV33058.1 Right origin-binding protein [Streptomyces sp. ADI95-16]RPK24611.1 Right origin-binding protein [Streptomyces sp. ADI91-18]
MTITAIEAAVLRVINDMHANLGQELTIDDMARTAMFSKFHFTRVFRDVTGTSPGRFLSALRLQEAKRLLIETEFSVADISSQVGYSSVGTFSSRFKSCVGASPSMYRQLDGFVPEVGPGPLPVPASPTPRNTLRGRIQLPEERAPGYCFVGLFPTPVPQGQPVRCSVLEGPGAFELRDVPAGTWHVLVHSVPYGLENQPSGTGDEVTVSVGRYGPVTAHADTLLMPAEITLRPLDALDPPVLMALLDLRTTALQAVAS